MTTALDTEFFRAFAGRVRTQLSTTIPDGNPTMSTATETTEVPATFLTTANAPCKAHAWCLETGSHLDHIGRRITLAKEDSEILTAYLYTDQATGLPALGFDPGLDDWQEYESGDGLREQTAKVRAHLARLDAFADEFDAIREAGGEPVKAAAPTEPEAPHRWVRRIRGGGQITETCPTWCDKKHAHDQGTMLPDLAHTAREVFLLVDTFDHWEDERPVNLPAPILAASVHADPYSGNPRRNVPFVSFEPWQDEVMDELTPDEFAAVIAQIRAHCDRLDQVHAQLVAARADWAKNGGNR